MSPLSEDDEPFQVFGGLNDIFIAIGVGLLSIGMFTFSMTAGNGGMVRAATLGIGVVVLWLMAEHLTGRLRMAGPSNVVAAAIAGFAFAAVSASGWSGDYALSAAQLLLAVVIALIVATAHYIRFRLPFSLFVMAVLALQAFIVGITFIATGGKLSSWTAMPMAWVNILAFVFGLFLFAIAMRYDMSDPERTTRRNVCGFWLHLAAAPMIVHPLAGWFLATGWELASVVEVVATLALLITLAAVALLIDRRAIMVAGFGYLGGAIAYWFITLNATPGMATVLTIMAIGALIVFLGLGWKPLRRGLFAVLPNFPGRHALPAIEGAA